jgi:hypothetical protein
LPYQSPTAKVLHDADAEKLVLELNVTLAVVGDGEINDDRPRIQDLDHFYQPIFYNFTQKLEHFFNTVKICSRMD